MRHLIDPETMRDCERAYFTGGADTSIEAMERAARALADCAMEYFGEIRENVIAVCGTGGNGGDGYACARILKSRGYDVSVLPIAPPKSADAIENARRAREANVPFLDA
ncbi:MAG: NAD(P)H-hydrate epimerase, partial [Clostridia bacterium]|nr:NAD(P)H-hydrate epimerase [Clostridia bacterium]